MTRARYQQILLDDTPYYHCVSRCVRRAYLCGDDPVSGQNFDHRKLWLVAYIKQLASQFAIDVCAYAIMSNHYHLVLFVNEDVAKNWNDEDVIRHWTALFPRNAAIIENLQKSAKGHKAQSQLVEQVEIWRERLTDISWFMRCLNESVARRANKEDDCTGRFWEGRFKSQALLDEKALVTCMAFVDLHPIRIGVSKSLESSDYTSIQERLINQAKKANSRSYRQQRLLSRRGAKHLVQPELGRKKSSLKSLAKLPGIRNERVSISQQSYFKVLEVTSRALVFAIREPIRATKVVEKDQSLLQAMGIPSDSWLKSIMQFHRHYGTAVGTEDSLIDFHQSKIQAGIDYKFPHKWIRGIHSARLLYGT